MNVAVNNDNEFLEGVDRARYLYRWSRVLDWDTAYTAAQLGVSPRTVNLWGSGAQPMPDARWMLFVLLVREAVEKNVQNDLRGVTPGGPELAVILGPDRLPLDVVSRNNYAGHLFDRSTGKGMVASVALDRVTGKERLHKQVFDLAGNDTIIRAAEQWAEYRDIVVTAQDRWAYVIHRQMVQQALRAEMKNPEIRALKDAVEKASMERNAVDDEQPLEVHQQAERKLQAAVKALQDAIAKGVED